MCLIKYASYFPDRPCAHFPPSTPFFSLSTQPNSHKNSSVPPFSNFPTMASSRKFLLFFFFFFCFLYKLNAQIPLLPDSVVLPVTRDLATLQYMTQVYHGSQRTPTELIIDLAAPFPWIDCASGQISSTRRFIPSCSIQCSMAKPFHLGHNNCFFDSSGNRVSTCDLSAENSFTRSATKGELAEDVIAFRSIHGSKSGEITQIDNFLFVCAPTALLNGLASGSQGILGLGNSPIALPSQLSATIQFHKKFATCLSSSSGVLSLGSVGSDSIFGPEILKSLTYTPLVNDPGGSSQDYFINVRSIKINGKRVALGQEGISRTKISTTVPYTTLESRIYGVFMNGYMKAAAFMNMTSVAPVAPFNHCFSSKGVESTILGPIVPSIDLVLQSEMVKWRIHGSNSMVSVSDEVICLGILDGGLDSKTSMVIGGLQLEDMLLEFDLGTSMLGFSLPLSCSNLKPESIGIESL